MDLKTWRIVLERKILRGALAIESWEKARACSAALELDSDARTAEEVCKRLRRDKASDEHALDCVLRDLKAGL